MKPKATDNFLTLAIVVLLCVLGGTLFSGCTGYTKDDARADRDAILAALPELDAEIAKLPEGDPVRKTWESKRSVLLKGLNVANAVIDEDPLELREAVKDIPYGSLIVGLGGLAWGLYQRAKRARDRKALTQVVESVEAAFPEKTDEQKLILSSVQDRDTQQTVNALKPTTPVATDGGAVMVVK